MISHSGIPSNVVYLCVEVSGDCLLGPVLVVKFSSPLCLRVTHSVGHHLGEKALRRGTQSHQGRVPLSPCSVKPSSH